MTNYVLEYNLHKRISVLFVGFSIWFAIAFFSYAHEMNFFRNGSLFWCDLFATFRQLKSTPVSCTLLTLFFATAILKGALMTDEILLDYINSKRLYKILTILTIAISLFAFCLAVQFSYSI